MSENYLEERQNVLRQMVSECELLSEMVEEIDIEFQKFGHIVQTAQFNTNSLGDEILGEITKALSHSEFLINKKDLEEISMQVQHKILSLETQFASTKEEFFDLGENGGQTQMETENLHG